MTRRQLLDLAKRAGIRRRHRMAKFRFMDELRDAGPARRPDFPPDADLPVCYGRTRLVLLDVEPYWLFAYWEITQDDRRIADRCLTEAAGREWVLRFYDTSGFPGSSIANCEHFDLPVDPDAGNWYINLWAGGKTYIAEIGVRLDGGRFAPLCRSNPVHVPPTGSAPDTPPRWIHISNPEETVAEKVETHQYQEMTAAVESSMAGKPPPEALPEDRGIAQLEKWLGGGREAFEDPLEMRRRNTWLKRQAPADSCRRSASGPPLESPLPLPERPSISSDSAGSFGLGWSRSQGPSRMKRWK